MVKAPEHIARRFSIKDIFKLLLLENSYFLQ